MRYLQTALPGVMVMELEPIGDERGFFARTFDAEEFAAHGLEPRVEQCNLSFNARRGTLRGLHYQDEPAGEDKLIRCVQGAMHAAVVDARPGSPTRWSHVSVELSRDNRRALFVPKGCAVGMQTLVDDTEVAYQVSARYTPAAERGLRWDDPALGIEWPLPVSVISDKDAAWPLLHVEDHVEEPVR